MIFIAEKLEQVEKGKITKLMIFCPPRHGKTEITSVRFPAWSLGKNPDRRIILASYAASLSHNFSRQVRDLVEEIKYQCVFGIKTKEDSRSAENWNIDGHKGGMLSAGVGGAITGYGADIFIIDDPVKNKEEAESKIYREKTWDWYQSVVRTRLEPDAAQIIILTRWHKEDLAGKILSEQDDWEVINMPAIAGKNDILKREEGQALWRKRYNEVKLKKTEKDVGSRVWAALYDGNPQDTKSQIIQRDWIQWYDMLPHGCIRGGGIDTATSKKDTGNFSSLVDICRDNDGYLYCDDVFLDKVSVKTLSVHVVNQHNLKRYVQIKIEENAAGEAIKQRIEEEGRMEKIYPPVIGFKTSTDKTIRVMEFQPLIESGTLKFNRNNPRVAALVDHLIDFPQGKIDDDVDALGFAIKSVTGFTPSEEVITEPAEEGVFELELV